MAKAGRAAIRLFDVDWSLLRPAGRSLLFGLLAALLAFALGITRWLDIQLMHAASTLPLGPAGPKSVLLISVAPEQYFSADALDRLQSALLRAGALTVERWSALPAPSAASSDSSPALSDPRRLRLLPLLDGQSLQSDGIPTVVAGRRLLLFPALGPAQEAAARQQASALAAQAGERGLTGLAVQLSVPLQFLGILLASALVVRLPGGSALRLALAVAATTLIAALLSYALLDLWPPAGGLLIGTAAAVLAGTTARQRRRNRTMRAVVTDLRGMLFRRMTPSPVRDQVDHWAALQQFVVQALNLERSIFLERIEGEGRVREVKAYRCGLHDISELRRDCERFPYDAAIRHRRPLQLSRPFLANVPPGNVQFLAPLVLGADVLGFWSFTLAEADLASNPELPGVAGEFATQLAEQLFQWREYHLQRSRREAMPRLLRGEDRERDELSSFAKLLQRRVGLFESVLHDSGSGILIFDCFGRPIHVNKPFEQVAAAAGLSIWDASAVDVLTRLSGIDGAAARQQMQRVLFDHVQPEIGIVANAERQTLRLSALQADDMERGDYPFGTLGYLFVINRAGAGAMSSPRVAGLLHEIEREAALPETGCSDELRTRLAQLRRLLDHEYAPGLDIGLALAGALRDYDRQFSGKNLSVQVELAPDVTRSSVDPLLGEALLDAVVGMFATELPAEAEMKILVTRDAVHDEALLLFAVPKVVWTSAQWNDQLDGSARQIDRRFTHLRNALARIGPQQVWIDYHSHPSAGTVLQLRLSCRPAESSPMPAP